MTDVAGQTKTEAFHFRARQPSLILAIRQMYDDLSEDTGLMLSAAARVHTSDGDFPRSVFLSFPHSVAPLHTPLGPAGRASPCPHFLPLGNNKPRTSCQEFWLLVPVMSCSKPPPHTHTQTRLTVLDMDLATSCHLCSTQKFCVCEM